MTRFDFTSRCATAALALVLAACSGDDDNDGAAKRTAMGATGNDGPASSLIEYIPANSPYFFANRDRISDQFMELIWDMAEPGLEYGQSHITRALNDEEATKDPLAKAVLDELNGNMSRAGLARLGFAPVGNLAFYGLGVLPVVRAEISDPDALRATIGRIETNSGVTFQRGTAGGVEYYEGGEKEAHVVVAIDGNQLIMSVVPVAAKDAALQQLLNQKPATNAMAKIDALNKQNELLPYGTFALDSVAMIDAVMTDNSPVAQAMFAEPRAELSAECVAEFRQIAGIMPQVVSGYTRIDDSELESVAIMSLRDDIARSLKGLAVAMPGLDQVDDSMLYFALALDLLKTKQFLSEQSAAVAAAPYQCDKLAELNDGMVKMQQQLAQPMPPMVGNIQGLRMSLKNIDMSAGMPQDVRALVMIGITNPQLIVGMAGAMVPQLASLQLSNDGTPQPLPADLIPYPLDEPHIAMMDHGLGFSIGTGEHANLGKFLDAKAPASGAPFMSLGYDMEAMRLYQEQMTKAMAAMSDDDVPQIPVSDRMDRVSGLISFTDRGIEVISTSYLNP